MVDYNRAFFARNLRPAFAASEAGQQILDWVEHRDQIYAGALAGEQAPPRTLDPSVPAALDVELAHTSAQAQAALGKVNPHTVATYGLFENIVSITAWGEDLRAGGLTQPIWSVGAAGAGATAPGGYLARYLRCYAQWRATAMLPDILHAPDKSSALTVMIGAQTPRLIPTRTSFWWASRELAQLIARHAPDGALPEAAVNELADYVDITAKEPFWWDGHCGQVPLSPAARRIAQSCSYRSGSRAEMPFEDLMYKRDIEVHPFIDVDGVIIPAALQSIFEAFHVAIFDALRKTCGKTVTGEIFERVCRDTLARLFSPSTRLLPDRMHVYDREGKQLGETDFAIANGTVLLLGEVKSQAAPGEVLLNGRRFTDQITHTIDQLNTVVGNLSSHEATLVADGQPVDTTGISTYIGFAVVLHDYGGGIWNAPLLQDARQGKAGFVIVRAADLMLLAHTLRDLDEFIDYLAFRQEFMASTGISVDEIDILAAYLENARWYRHRFRTAPDDPMCISYLLPRHVDKTLLQSTVPPKSSGPWRATVANLTKLRS